tara:strand:+ start:1502 stop:4789 length:3288 start_codon:yes stop_codon:yes gene_type:complete
MKELLNKTHRQIFCYNKDIGHLFVPNLNARIMNENGGYYVRSNSLGFRSNTEFIEKKSDKPRILFFGDSNTAADGVSNNERFSELVGEYFKAEVYNFALSGSGTDQQYLIRQKYAQKVEADLIVFGILVDNIERNKVAYRETINPYTKKNVLTPKPYFRLEKGKLKLSNSPVPRIKSNLKEIDPYMVQWAIPRSQELIYKLIAWWRKNKALKPVRDNFEPLIKRLRSLIIKMAYQPYPDYGDPTSHGYLLMKEIINEFINSFSQTPIIILPIPTYHYYVDGAKPIYKQFFNYFHNPTKNVYVLDPLEQMKNIDYNKRQSLCFKQDKSHFSKYGHQVISDFLTRKINNRQVLLRSKPIKNFEITNITKKNSVYILGISAFYHDSAAALIKDGEIIAAAQEERFSRRKHDRRFPLSAINFCLEKANIQQSDLSTIVYYDNTSLTFERMLWSFAKTVPNSQDTWLRTIPSWVKYKFFLPQLIRKKLKYNGKILHDLHHRSHIAAAFFPSPFKKAAILTVDGVGEWATASIGIGEENRITMLKEMNFPNSIGLLYSAFTQFTGFKVNSGEYKMMGLAPYGNPIYVDVILEKLIAIKKDGSVDINQNYFNYLNGSVMTNENFDNLFGGSARAPESRITQREMDIACSIQKVTEKIILRMALYVKKLTGAEYLCMAGGVALNCVANGYLLKENLFKDIWIQPAAGDAGSSLGCALDAYHTYLNNPRKLRKDGKSIQGGSFWGPEWSADEIKSFLDSENIKHHVVDYNKRSSLIANYLNEGKVVGHFSGRTEFGPRALGARSIIGDPRSKEMQTNINLKIKRRESFRPFAPTVLAEKVNKYFELNKTSPYMLLIASVNKNRRLPFDRGNKEDMLEMVRQPRSDIPAVTHIDYSARIQTIEKGDHRKFYDLVKAFEELTGYGIIVNTSFNVRGEPIVNSPMDAYRCFMNTEMDVLVLEDYFILKEEQTKTSKKESLFENFDTKITKDNDKFLRKKLYKLYKKNFISASRQAAGILEHQYSSASNWSNCIDQNDRSKIFDIPVDLDITHFDPQKMAKSIIKYWRNNSFGKILEPTLILLLSLGKKYPLEEDINSVVSEKTYEMF